MNWVQFKDPVSRMCRVGTEVTFWSLTQEVAGSSPFIEKHLGKTPIITLGTIRVSDTTIGEILHKYCTSRMVHHPSIVQMLPGRPLPLRVATPIFSVTPPQIFNFQVDPVMSDTSSVPNHMIHKSVT